MGEMIFETTDGFATRNGSSALREESSAWTEKLIADTFDARTLRNMKTALERACDILGPRGGEHETRQYIAAKILTCAQGGDKTLSGLTEAGEIAATELCSTHGA